MKIIGISGKKQSGKNTFANFVNGSILDQYGLVDSFTVNQDGLLEVKTENIHGKKGWGILDVTRKDKEFCDYALENVWPFVKVYHFADYLKKICVDLFDLTSEQVYGTDKDKNTPTPYDGKTSREFLQWFGTDIMRSIKDSIWVDYTIKQIKQEQSAVSLIPDVRFPNEVKAIKEAGGCVVRLTREAYASEHHCETALDSNNFDWKEFDYIIDNHDMSIEQLGLEIEKIKQVWSI